MSTLSELYGAGGGANFAFPERIFYSSTTFTPSVKVKVLIHCFGGGGAGGGAIASIGNTTNSYSCMAAGGGAGEHSGSIFTLDPSVTYTITVGAGGGRVGLSAYDTGTTGVSGTASSFSGSDITDLTANGGAGGVGEGVSTAGLYEISGALGGTNGTGTLFNFTGGSSGYCRQIAGTRYSMYQTCMATGGGAVGIWADGNGSGNATKNSGSHTQRIQSHGGTVIDGYASGASFAVDTFYKYTTAPRSIFDRLNHHVQLSDVTNAAQPPGVRGVAKFTTTAGASFIATRGGLFAGGGAFGTQGINQSGSYLNGGRFGGGGGGSTNNSRSGDPRNTYPGNGGAGGVIMEPLEIIE